MSASLIHEESLRELRSALEQAIDNNKVSELAEILSDAETNNTPIDVNEFVCDEGERKMLHLAALHGRHEIVLYLLETQNADVDVRERFQGTPLMLAAYCEKMEAFKCLLEHGADLNATSYYFGLSAMHYAAMKNRDEMIIFVLENKDRFLPNFNLQDDDGNTPFLLACKSCSTSIIARMLHGGANLDLRDSYGCTGLHYAARNIEHPKAVEMLANLGLDVNARDNRGDSPLHEARSVEIAHLLIYHGANLYARNKKREIPEQSICEQDARNFVALVRSFRETRQRWSPMFGLDRNKTNRDRANQEENTNGNDNNNNGLRPEIEENAAVVKTFLLPKAVHQLLGQPGNVRKEVMMGRSNVAFLVLRENGPKAMEELHGGDKKCSKRKDPPKYPSMQDRPNITKQL